MDLFNILGNAFRPNQLDEFEFESDETELKECKWCEAYHAEDSDFCSKECETHYWKEYGDDTEGCDQYHADKDNELSNN